MAGVHAALRRTDGQAAFLLGTVGYPFLYLGSLGHLALGGRGYAVRAVADPVSRALEPTRAFSFEPVASVVIEPLILLVSPLDIGLAVSFGVLLGCNLAIGVVAWRSPAACGIEGSAGVFAGLPALLTGATCCGPAVLLVLGVGATGPLLTALGYATPVTGLALVGSLLVVAGRRPHD
ncbi:hypothetical protein ACFQL0_14145 [Haloplanus litoreus]|uniref:hypothetical protein n=1 Tax=Haloplanus litoreus TaxID=767515 RepID=UPI00360A1E23